MRFRLLCGTLASLLLLNLQDLRHAHLLWQTSSHRPRGKWQGWWYVVEDTRSEPKLGRRHCNDSAT